MKIVSGDTPTNPSQFDALNTTIQPYWAMVDLANDLLHRKKRLHHLKTLLYRRKSVPIHQIYPIPNRMYEAFCVIHAKVCSRWETVNCQNVNPFIWAEHGFVLVLRPKSVKIAVEIVTIMIALRTIHRILLLRIHRPRHTCCHHLHANDEFQVRKKNLYLFFSSLEWTKIMGFFVDCTVLP